MSVHSSATCLVSQTRNFDEHANPHRESCLRAGRKMRGTRWTPADRAEIKYFLRACARTEFIGFPRLDSTNFAAVALFSLRFPLYWNYSRESCLRYRWAKKKKKEKKTETRGKENQVDRWNNSNRSTNKAVSRFRNCLNALPSFFLPLFFSPFSSSFFFFFFFTYNSVKSIESQFYDRVALD